MSDRRKEYLLDLLGKNLSQDEIMEKMDAREERLRRRRERGTKSEQLAAETIKEIEMVKDVKVFSRNSKKDKKGMDLEVTILAKKAALHFGRPFNTPLVWVQVKSSRTGVIDFRSANGKTEEERDQALAKRKLIVLNGKSGPEKIVESFTRQLKYIDKYQQQLRGGS